jgi:hypothetical protein
MSANLSKKRKIKRAFLILTILFFNIQSFSQIETDKWKLFENGENHFSIKFPECCTEIITNGPVSESIQKQKKANGSLRFSSTVLTYSVTFGNDVVPIYSLSIYQNPDSLALKEFVYKIIIDNLNTYQKSDITIKSYDYGNLNSVKAYYANQVGGYTGVKSELFVQRENEVFRLNLYTDSKFQYGLLFNAIIKTLHIET